MNAFPQIVRCTLGQGGGPAYLDEMDSRAAYAARVFGDSVLAKEWRPVVLEPEPPPVTHSTLARWALNLSVVKELAEPTREEI